MGKTKKRVLTDIQKIKKLLKKISGKDAKRLKPFLKKAEKNGKAKLKRAEKYPYTIPADKYPSLPDKDTRLR